MTASQNNLNFLTVSHPLRAIESGEILFEACERRLVLSAQLIFDVLGDQALELHGDLVTAPIEGVIPVESHLQEAHAVTGWNTVQQQFGLTGKGQTVAVIDSGIAWDHVALGKGFGPGYRVVGGWDFTEENDANPYDDGPLGFHGTHVAGIIGSDDAINTGVAPDTDLVALRVFNDAGQGQLSWVERALQWVHDNRNTFENPITTVNLSLGTVWNDNVIPNWATLEEEFQQLFNDGIVVTASAGNSFQQYLSPGLSYPAVSPYVLPVASVDDNGQLSDFSQRNDHVIAAPGRNIVSTVPDHVLGRDGKIDDFTAASGTSMAAPYVAGASVLVRQAMEMVGYVGINLTSIANHLHATADSVYDAVTGVSYDRLNLEEAIDALIPDDNVGDTIQTALHASLDAPQLSGWINTLADQDVYHFTPATDGMLRLDADSQWLESLHWSLQTSAGQQVLSGSLDPASISVIAGQTYNLVVAANHEIGSFQFNVGFTSTSSGGESGSDNSGSSGNPTPPTGTPLNLGQVHYLEQNIEAGRSLRVQASQDGTFSVQWSNPDAPTGTMSVFKDGNNSVSDWAWSNGTLRVDLEVTAGQWLDIQLPGHSSDLGELALANIVARHGSDLTLRGTLDSDTLSVNLQSGLSMRFGEIEYAYPTGAIANVTIDAGGGNDQLSVVGSTLSDKVDLRPSDSTIQNSQIQLNILGVEEITYQGGGGPDRVYLYDSDGDDVLTARPRSAELVGAGYRFAVEQIDRIYIHATGAGQDYAYLYDSSGDDRLSVRPQFSSMSGDGFFNYVRGFERVFAYANAGGYDQADLYDSDGNDRFNTSGASASIVGPNFSSFTRSFEQVNAYADAGGQDLATLYGSSAQTQWQQGSDFIRFTEDGMTREARGFRSIETYVAGQTHALATAGTTASLSLSHLGAEPTSADNIDTLAVMPIESPWSVQASAWAAAVNSWDTQQPLSVDGNEPSLPSSASLGPQLPADSLPEQQVLQELQQVAQWLSERLILPDENLLLEPDAEFAVLDEIFSRH